MCHVRRSRVAGWVEAREVSEVVVTGWLLSEAMTDTTD